MVIIFITSAVLPLVVSVSLYCVRSKWINIDWRNSSWCTRHTQSLTLERLAARVRQRWLRQKALEEKHCSRSVIVRPRLHIIKQAPAHYLGCTWRITEPQLVPSSIRNGRGGSKWYHCGTPGPVALHSWSSGNRRWASQRYTFRHPDLHTAVTAIFFTTAGEVQALRCRFLIYCRHHWQLQASQTWIWSSKTYMIYEYH